MQVLTSTENDPFRPLSPVRTASLMLLSQQA
jgi:hypothetical protein